MWIAITLLAACLQIARTSEQHRLRVHLNTVEAGYARFVYAFPVTCVLLGLWLLGSPSLPATNLTFWGGVVGGGIAQILATLALLHSFKLRDFAIGTIYAKTEVLFVGAGSAVILGEPLTSLGWLGVLICLVGVAWLALSRTTGDDTGDTGDTGDTDATGISNLLDPAAGFGVLAACGFALAAIGIRGASSSLEGSVVTRALMTLTVMLGVQTLLQGIAIAQSSASSLRRVAAAWRPATLVAGLSLSGSFAWATAMTLENAAKVRTLGQIEIILAFAIGVAVHNEHHRRSEYVASAVAAAGIGLLVLS